MATINGISSFTKLGLNNSCSIIRRNFLLSQKFRIQSRSRGFRVICALKPDLIVSRRSKIRGFRLFSSVKLNSSVTSDDEISEVFLEAIKELRSMTREPSDVLEEMNEKLTARELQLVLVYFSQEGRDSWCALEVFEWLRKENKVDKETMELMVSIMCLWIKKLIKGKSKVGQVIDLLVDMDCVGLRPRFSMIEKVISMYWGANEKENAVAFVEEVLRRGVAYTNDDKRRNPGGPTGYLAWKMMVDGKYKDAVKLVIHIKEYGLKPEVYSYLIAMSSVVKELQEVATALCKLKRFAGDGLISKLDAENTKLIQKYQEELLEDGVLLSNWVLKEGSDPSLAGLVHERLLAMYICAECGVEAERELWEMKLAGKEPEGVFYDVVLAICASQKKSGAVGRLLTRTELTSPLCRKKSLSWLLKGYIKGGHFENAAETVTKMLDLGFYPEYLDRGAVLQGLRKRIHRAGNLETYLKLCERLSNANLIVPCLVYLHIKKRKLWIIKMI